MLRQLNPDKWAKDNLDQFHKLLAKEQDGLRKDKNRPAQSP
jgi:hypothetical protein